MKQIKRYQLDKIIENYRSFLALCSVNDDFRLTPNSEISPYALCFGIFGHYLIRDFEFIDKKKTVWVEKIISNLENFKIDKNEKIYSKPYLQLLTFSLSALYILESINHPALKNHVAFIKEYDINYLLNKMGVKSGLPSSGNMAMFSAILLIHLREHMESDVDKEINSWVSYHLNHMNKFGFWGDAKNMNYLMFQNGYHQYEIFDYLNIKGSFWSDASKNINSLRDDDFRFAPYPGGGGCYDYDALFMLTSDSKNNHFNETIMGLCNSVLCSQNADGGFCESKDVRPRNIKKSIKHIFSRPKSNQYEVLKRLISIQRFRHNRIHTHWTDYSRKWNESDLWDSWFRLLLLARVDVHIDQRNFKKWGFINYPGIGYHHLCKNNIY
jgi:hypothetical protein